MDIRKYNRNPTPIEAVQYLGTQQQRLCMAAWILNSDYSKSANYGTDTDNEPFEFGYDDNMYSLKPGDWLAKGLSGEFFPIPAETFKALYTPAPSDYIERMQAELADLGQKIEKARADMQMLPDLGKNTALALLKEQLTHMLNYRASLDARIAAAGE